MRYTGVHENGATARGSGRASSKTAASSAASWPSGSLWAGCGTASRGTRTSQSGALAAARESPQT